jgi:DNA-binding MarR family transcriptional regulator
VEKLKQKGFVDRKENKDDRRHVDITITAKGLALLEKIDVANNDGILKDNLSVKEAEMLNDLLDKLRG